MRMDHGKVNAMDLEFCRLFSKHLEELSQSDDCKAVVLTGKDRIFSAGVDLVRLIGEPVSYLDEFLPELSRCFRTLFEFPKPIVAAINGHAIAGGCILGTACDRRLIHPKARIGLPELRVGVSLPSVAVEIMRFAAAKETFQTMVTVGKNYRGQEAVDVGLADEVMELEKLEACAIDAAEAFTAIPANVFAISKKQMRQPALDLIERNEALFEKQIRALWRTDEIRKEIESYVKNRL